MGIHNFIACTLMDGRYLPQMLSLIHISSTVANLSVYVVSVCFSRDISSDKSYPYHGGTTNGYFLHLSLIHISLDVFIRALREYGRAYISNLRLRSIFVLSGFIPTQKTDEWKSKLLRSERNE